MTLKKYTTSLVFRIALLGAVGLFAVAHTSVVLAETNETFVPSTSTSNDVEATVETSGDNSGVTGLVPLTTGANQDNNPSVIPVTSGSNDDDNTQVATTTPPTTTPPTDTTGGGGSTGGSTGGSSGGGFSGGSGGGNFQFGTSSTSTIVALPLIRDLSQCSYITEYMQIGRVNNPVQVVRLQQFLSGEGFTVAVTGVFGNTTKSAVQNFQQKYLSEIMTPWGSTQPSGYVYITTAKKINELFCKANFSLTPAQIATIEAYRRNRLENSSNLDSNNLDELIGVVSTSTASTTQIIGQSTSTDSTANTAAVVNTGIFAKIWAFIKRLFGR